MKYLFTLLAILFVKSLEAQQAYSDFDEDNSTPIAEFEFDDFKGWDGKDKTFFLEKNPDGVVHHISKGQSGTKRISYFRDEIELPKNYQIDLNVKYLSGLTGFDSTDIEVKDLGGVSFYWNTSKEEGASRILANYSMRLAGKNRISLFNNGHILISGRVIKPLTKEGVNAYMPGEFNTVTLRKYANKFYVYLNKEFLTSYSDPQADVGIAKYIGIESPSAKGKFSKGKAAFDWIRISELHFVPARSR